MNSSAPSRPFWQRRVRDPLIGLFTQGLTPDKVALMLSVGTACSLFPIFGLTSLLNLGVGLWLRLNQPLLQALNQLLGPVHLMMIVVYVRLGEWVWSAQDEQFTIREMVRLFHEESLGDFFRRFAWVGVHALTAWALTTPVLVAILYYAIRPALRRLATKSARAAQIEP